MAGWDYSDRDQSSQGQQCLVFQELSGNLGKAIELDIEDHANIPGQVSQHMSMG